MKHRATHTSDTPYYGKVGTSYDHGQDCVKCKCVGTRATYFLFFSLCRSIIEQLSALVPSSRHHEHIISSHVYRLRCCDVLSDVIAPISAKAKGDQSRFVFGDVIVRSA